MDPDQSGHTRQSFGDRGNTVAHGEGLLRHAVVPAVLGGLAVQPDLIGSGADAGPVGDSYDWHVDTAAEQLSQYQCLMADVLRLGGPSMATTAQDGLNQPAGQLHTLADRECWEKTPLAGSYEADRDAARKELDALHARGARQAPRHRV